MFQVYPKNDITNIVESSHYVKIGNWCKMGYNKCKHTDWVKPYRCLGKFAGGLYIFIHHNPPPTLLSPTIGGVKLNRCPFLLFGHRFNSRLS